MTTFFIKHPVIAIVLNIMVSIIGYLSLDTLALREYPQVKIPVFSVWAHYKNADISLMESSVTNPLENEISGISGIDLIKSKTRAESCEIDIKFQEGVNYDKAMIALRGAIGLSRQALPKEMPDPILREMEGSDVGTFMNISVSSLCMPLAEINHFSCAYLKNVFRSIPGVANVDVLGQSHVMQVILSPEKMFSFGVNVHEVYEALNHSLDCLPVGKFQNNIPATLDTRLQNERDFLNVLIKRDKQNTNIFLEDVAQVALDTTQKEFRVRINTEPGVVLCIQCASDANVLEVSALIRQKISTLLLPKGMKLNIIADQSDFIRSSLAGIKSAMIEAILLVIAVVTLFLRNLNLSLVPIVTIPISLLGSCAVLKLFNCSLNAITLFGMILSIGLVVDDAIVVLENIARHKKDNTSSSQAAILGAKEITFAIIAMTFTLSSVYAPLTLLPGAIGQIFKEFAISVSGGVLVSGLIALTLSPLMCSRLLKKPLPHIDLGESFLRKILLLQSKKILLLFPCLLLAIGLFLKTLPKDLVPKEDRGEVLIFIAPTPGKSIDTLDCLVRKMEAQFFEKKDVERMVSVVGNWGADIKLILKDYKKRNKTALQLLRELDDETKNTPSQDVWLDTSGCSLPGINQKEGSNLKMIISSVKDCETMYWDSQKALKKIKKHFPQARHDLNFDTPNFKINLNKKMMGDLKIKPEHVAKTIEVFFSGSDVLEFSKDGILYPIHIKGSKSPWTLDELYITNEDQERISLGVFANLERITTAQELKHHNQMRTLSLVTPLEKDDDLSKVMPKFLKCTQDAFPQDYIKEWGGIAKAYEKSLRDVVFLFVMAVVFIYAILCIQFENFIDPFIVLLTVPFACFGGLLFMWIFNQSLNIFTHIGFITLIGLIAKNGILIVEFANHQKDPSLKNAAIQATLLRLKPILMTTCAMIAGSIPLTLAHGAGAEMQKALGVVLIGGLSIGTLLVILFIPKIYEMIKNGWVLTRSK